MIPIILGTDYDSSGGVNFIDYAYFILQWGNVCDEPNNWCNGCDIYPLDDPDGIVDGNDLDVFFESWLWGLP
ncbi:MAG: hypothetical protein ACYS9V_12760 [Planctomycetota bacterium]|jgi:hypothetical protein